MNQLYKFRTGFIFLLLCSLFTIALIHLFSLQIRQHNRFIDLAHKQYQVSVTTLAPRAFILDRNNQPLALNKDSLAAFILPQTLEDPEKTKAFLKKHFPSTLEKLKKNPKAHFLYVKRKLSPEQLQLLEESQVTDIKILTEPSRFYPIEAAGSITGITNIDNLGLFGIELQCDKQLAGTPTTRILEKDARSGHFYFSKEITQEGTTGTPVKLTIDGNLQFLVQEELNAQIKKYKSVEGAAVVLDPQTGDILAMASFPNFNPNETTELDLITTKNTAITESYEFGSAFKAFTALAALEEGMVTPDEVIDCENSKSTYVAGRKINNFEAQGLLTFEEVIARSNNIGIAKVAMRLGPQLYNHHIKLGFGKKVGISFPGEQAGFVNPPNQWSKHSIISLSYGYEIRATLLQVARAFSIFTNGGYLIQPRIILEPEQYQKKPEKIYSDQSIAFMRTILEKTTSLQGTAKYAALHGYTTLGKTSTANLIVDGKYDPTKNFYGFIGIVEKGSYKKVVGCFLKESPQKDLYAATVAAPLFKKIVEKLLIHSNIIAEETHEADHSSNSTT